MTLQPRRASLIWKTVEAEVVFCNKNLKECNLNFARGPSARAYDEAMDDSHRLCSYHLHAGNCTSLVRDMFTAALFWGSDEINEDGAARQTDSIPSCRPSGCSGHDARQRDQPGSCQGVKCEET